MYFLKQIKFQFLSQIALHQEAVGENAGAGVDEITDLNEADKRLGVLEATTKIAGTELEIILRGLEKIAKETPEERRDPDFIQLLQRINRLKTVLEETKREGMQIDHVLRQSISEVREGISDVQGSGGIDSENRSIGELDQEFIGYREALNIKLKPFVGQQNLSPTMSELVEEFKTFNFTSINELPEAERLAYLSQGGTEALKELNTQADIALRDEQVVGEQGEKLGDVRLDSVHKAYNTLLENDAIKTALTSPNGQTPSFEELQINHIKILRDAGVNLAELFLVDENGKSISGTIEAGNTYIVNFSTNQNLHNTLNPSFIFTGGQELKIDGQDTAYEAGIFQKDGKPILLQDGSKVSVNSLFTTEDTTETPPQEAEVAAVLDQYSLAASDEQMVQEALASPNPQAAFEGMTLPGGITGLMLMFLAKMFTGKEFEYNAETGGWTEKNTGEILANSDIVDGSMGRYYDNGERIDVSSDMNDLPEGVRGLVNTIYQAESGGDPNIIYSGCNLNPNPPITQMTVREVRAFQDRMVAEQKARGRSNVSSAVGACQVIRDTLDGAINAGVLSPDQKFDMAAQNKFTLWKLEQRGLNDFTSGKISNLEFMKRLSQEWASLPKDMSGAGYYDGHAGNRALVSPQQILRHIDLIGGGK